MARHNDKGKYGEKLAVEWLTNHGYRILEQNWYFSHKEIDIICTDEKYIIIVEVKYRNGVCERPYEILDNKKKRNLLQAGAAYLHFSGLNKELRFDLILINGKTDEVLHIQDAILVID